MKKMNKKILALLAAGALIIGMSPIEHTLAITTETLDETSGKYTQVSGEGTPGHFDIVMRDASDTVEIYQIAQMKWTESTYEEVAWVPAVKTWLEYNGYASYNTPQALAAAASSIQTDVLKDMFISKEDSAHDPIDTSNLTKVAAGNIEALPPSDPVYITSENYTSFSGITKVIRYTDGVNTYAVGETYTNPSGNSVTVIEGDNAGLTPITIYCDTNATDETTKSGHMEYQEGELFQQAKEGTIRVTNIPLGMYMVLGSYTGGSYAPLTASVVPERDGANGNWYLKDELTYAMKAAKVTMNKLINGKPADEVRAGETVEFEIEFTLPIYQARDTSKNNVAAYTLSFDDYLDSKAFLLDPTSVSIQYRTSADGPWTTLGNEYYSSIIASAKASTGLIPSVNATTGALTNGGLSVWGCSTGHLKDYAIYENAVSHYNEETGKYEVWYYYYYYRNGAYHLLTNSGSSAYTLSNSNSSLNGSYKCSYISQLAGSSTKIYAAPTPSKYRLAADTTYSAGYMVRAIYSNATGDAVNHGWSEYATSANQPFTNWYKTYYQKDFESNIFNVTFDYDKLLTMDDFVRSTPKVRIVYNSEVTADIRVGSEANLNRAVMKYEANSAGTLFSTIEDTVNAYSYSLQLIKLDGDTQKPLSNATFDLFKEAYIFDADGNYDGLADKDTVDESVTIPSGKFGDHQFKELVEADYTPTGGETQLEAYGAKLTSEKTRYYTVENEDGTTSVFLLYMMSTDAKKKYFEGVIQSVADSEGVKLSGLDSGRYVLQETGLPSAEYNWLAEDVLFDISQLSDTEIATNYAGSLAAFVDGGSNVHTDGNYPITVLNYKGTVLPSTGGIGTTIFIILGILLMLLAMIIVIVKNRKKTETISFILAFALLFTAVFAGSSTAYAVTSVTVNESNGRQVTGNPTTNFTVSVKDKEDVISVYKVAEMNWNDDRNTYDDLQWVYTVTQWFKSTSGSAYAKYATPEELGAATTAEQTAFWNALLEDAKTNLNNLESSDKLKDEFVTKNIDGENTSYLVSDVHFGIYLITGSNGTKTYQPLSVDVIPTQSGPYGHYFLSNSITATLKFETVGIEKTINEGSYATVKVGDDVSFDIVAEVPDYPAKDASDTSKYPYSIDDVMSKAFEYNKDAKLYYSTDGKATWQELTTGYTLLMVPAATGTTPTSYGMGIYTSGTEKIYVNVTPSGYDCYALDDASKQLVKLNAAVLNGNFNTVSAISNDTVLDNYNKLFKTNVASFGKSNTSTWKPVYNATFDYDYLRDTLEATHVRLSYTAKITSDIEVGTQNNTNTASLYYQKDAGGTIEPKPSTVYAYTYGMNLVKLDGESETKKGLGGAKFSLYEAKYLYVPTSADGDAPGTDDSDYASYTFYTDIYSKTPETTTAPKGYTSTANAVEELTTLNLVSKVVTNATSDPVDIKTADTFYRKVKVTSSAESPCGVCGRTDEHYHIWACTLINDKIEPAGDLVGFTVEGLEPATYVLKETLAPKDYNLLNEAIIFDINDLTGEEITAQNTTHATFKSDDGTFYTTGIYPIEVANYSGTVLPSTGGIGTILFTILGISVMLLVIVMIILISRRREEEPEF